MATTEHTGLMTYIDENGNHYILYPVTNVDAVDGLQEELNNKVSKSSVVNNFTTTEEGFVADARALKELKVLSDTKQSTELIWENASPESEFARQSLPIDTAGYTFLDVEFRISYHTDVKVFRRAAVGVTTSCFSDDYYGKIITRNLDLEGSDVSFYAGYFYNTYGSYAEHNGYMIPVRIYGIKGVSA
jgi:hypothetical protein